MHLFFKKKIASGSGFRFVLSGCSIIKITDLLVHRVGQVKNSLTLTTPAWNFVKVRWPLQCPSFIKNCYFHVISYEMAIYGCENNAFSTLVLPLVNELYKFKSLLYLSRENTEHIVFQV